MQTKFGRVRMIVLKHWRSILVVLCILIFSHRFYLIKKINADFEVVPFRYLYFKRYPDIFIKRYNYDSNTDREEILLLNNYLPNVQAHITVSKTNIEGYVPPLLSEKEAVIDRHRGIQKAYKIREDGSRSNPYDYFTEIFTFIENGYYYRAKISNRNKFLQNILLKDLVENIIPHENAIDVNFDFRYFTLDLDEYFYLKSYDLNSLNNEYVKLEGQNILKGLVSITIETFSGQFNPDNENDLRWNKFDFDGKIAYKTDERVYVYEGFRYRMYPEIVIILDDRYLKIESMSDNSHGIEVYEYIDNIVESIKLK